MIALITGITINSVHMGKTIAQKGAHVVKDGKRHKDVMVLLLGIPPKLIFWGFVLVVHSEGSIAADDKHFLFPARLKCELGFYPAYLLTFFSAFYLEFGTYLATCSGVVVPTSGFGSRAAQLQREGERRRRGDGQL